MLNFSLSMRTDVGGSTYDSFHGWVIWGNNNFLEKTKDGRLFEPFPYPPENLTHYTRTCLESLNNGGDIFTTMKGLPYYNPPTYIFRMNSSAWERQPNSPNIKKGKFT